MHSFHLIIIGNNIVKINNSINSALNNLPKFRSINIATTIELPKEISIYPIIDIVDTINPIKYLFSELKKKIYIKYFSYLRMK